MAQLIKADLEMIFGIGVRGHFFLGRSGQNDHFEIWRDHTKICGNHENTKFTKTAYIVIIWCLIDKYK